MAKATAQIKPGRDHKGKGKSTLDVRIARIRKMPKYKTQAYVSMEDKIQAALDAYKNPEETESPVYVSPPACLMELAILR